MRILARVHGYVPDHNAGAETTLHALLRALVQRGHEAVVWISRYAEARETYDIDGVQVIPARARVDPHVKKADVLVTHLENTDPTAAIARGYGIPLVILVHNTHRPTIRQVAQSNPALVIFNSMWMADVYGGHQYGMVIHPPVVPGEYATTPGDRVTIVNTSPSKGGDVFRRVAQRLPEVGFLAVRGAYGNPVDMRGVDNIEELGPVRHDRMRDEVFGRTRILLMPSDYESYGRVGVEALASGIPVIAHPTEGLVESLGDAGKFIDRDEIDLWTAQINRWLNEKSWQRASERALKRSAELDPAADLDRWCDQVEQLPKTR